MSDDPRLSIPDGNETLLNYIVGQLMARLTDALYDGRYGAGPDNPLLFDMIGWGNLEDISPRMTPAAMFENGTETASGTRVYNHDTKNHRLYVHFKIIKQHGIDQSPLIDYYFGRIVQVLVKPDDFETIKAMDIIEVGKSTVYNGRTDPEPGGTIWFDVEYRHLHGDPMTE